MAKKRITDITVERTALLTTDYIAGDSTTGTNNTCKISTPNLLAQLRDGPTSPTFQVSLSTLATAGLGGVSRLARGFDIFGSNPKATTAAVQNLFQVGSNDAANPLALRLGVKTDATGGSRYGSIDVDDGGTRRSLILQSTGGGTVGIGVTGVVLPKFQVNHTGVSDLWITSDSQAVDAKVWAFQNGTGIGANLFRLVALNDANTVSSVAMQILRSGVTVQSVAFPIVNVGIGTTTFGASAVKVLAMGNGTIPGTLADAFQLVSADIVAGNAAPHFVTEAGPVIRLYQQAHIVDPAAGGTVDAEARTAINAILVALENTRLLAAA